MEERDEKSNEIIELQNQQIQNDEKFISLQKQMIETMGNAIKIYEFKLKKLKSKWWQFWK